MRVVVSDPLANQKEYVERLRAALQLLLDMDARRYRLVRRYVAHVIIWPGDYTAYDRWGGMHLASRYLLSAPVGIIAGGLVHEAVHLRINKAGIEYVPAARARIENICVREQADFLRKLPTYGVRWAEEAEADLVTPWWTEELRRKRVDRVAREAGLSKWTTAVLKRWSRGR